MTEDWMLNADDIIRFVSIRITWNWIEKEIRIFEKYFDASIEKSWNGTGNSWFIFLKFSMNFIQMDKSCTMKMEGVRSWSTNSKFFFYFEIFVLVFFLSLIIGHGYRFDSICE